MRRDWRSTSSISSSSDEPPDASNSSSSPSSSSDDMSFILFACFFGFSQFALSSVKPLPVSCSLELSASLSSSSPEPLELSSSSFVMAALDFCNGVGVTFFTSSSDPSSELELSSSEPLPLESFLAEADFLSGAGPIFCNSSSSLLSDPLPLPDASSLPLSDSLSSCG